MEARGNVSHQNKVIITQYNKVISIRHKAKFRQVCMQPVIKPWSSLTWDSSPVTRPTVCAGITWLLLRCPCNWDFFPCNPLSGRWGKSVHMDTFNPNPTAGVLFPFPHSTCELPTSHHDISIVTRLFCSTKDKLVPELLFH